jgi:hypothetical protein
MKINTSHLIGAVIALAAVFFSKLDAQDAQNKAEPQKWEYAIFGVMEPRSDSSTAILLPNKGPTELQSYDFPEDLTSNSWDMADLLNIMGNKGWQLCGTEREQQEHGDISTYIVRFYFKRPKQ